MSFQHWCVVRTLVKTAIFIPIHPHAIDVTAPITNAMVVGTFVKHTNKIEKSTM